MDGKTVMFWKKNLLSYDGLLNACTSDFSGLYLNSLPYAHSLLHAVNFTFDSLFIL